MARPPTIPLPYRKAIAWCQSRAPKWLANRAILKLTEQEAQEMQALTDAAAQSAIELQRARERYRAAVADCRVKTNAMRERAGGLISRIRAVARTSGTPRAIYIAGGLAAPDKRSPLPAPGTPTSFRVALEAPTGTLRVRFECKHPRGVRGVTYRVDRAVYDGGAQRDFAPLTIAKERAFTDSSVPPGAVVVIYRVTAQTSTKDGPVAIHMVRLAGEDVVVASPLPAHRSPPARAA
ncbi:MAG: hypothetical protein RIB58_12625 [Phycisphaerales bacterium]